MCIWNTTAARLQLHNGSAWTAGMVRLDGDTMTGALTIGVGTLATTGLRLAQTWSGGAGTTHRGMEVAITATAGQFAAASTLFRVLGGAAGATDRLTIAEEKMVFTGTEAVGQVFSIASAFGTATFAVGGGGALAINNSAQVHTNGVTGFQTGNAANGVFIGWDSQSSLPTLRPTGAVLQVGFGAASPTAYTLRGNSSRAGTDSNAAGASLTIAGGNGTGTGGGGSLIFQTSPTGSSGSTANTLTTRMTINRDGIVNLSNVPASSAGLATGDLYHTAGAVMIVL
jgi:hypothetical protein